MSLSKPRRIEILVVGGLIFGLWFVMAMTFEQARKRARGATCQSHLKQLGLSVSQYVRDYDEKYPLAQQWREDLLPYTKKHEIFHCPARTANGYAYNRYLHGQDYVRVDDLQGHEKTPLFFDSSLQCASATDFGSSWPNEKVHPRGNGVVFADAHAEWRHKPPIFRSFAVPKPKARLKSKTQPSKGKVRKIN